MAKATQRPFGENTGLDAGHRSERSLRVFFFNDTATTEIYTLSLHDALPINDTATPRSTLFPYTTLFRSRCRRIIFPADGGTPDGYADLLGAAVGLRYRPDAFISDMDAGFYSADYLRAWIRAAQLRAHLQREIGADWWRRRET